MVVAVGWGGVGRGSFETRLGWGGEGLGWGGAGQGRDGGRGGQGRAQSMSQKGWVCDAIVFQ